MPNAIQPPEYSKGSGTGGIPYSTDSDDNLKVFNVNTDCDDRWLNSNNGKPDNFWNGNNQWVFVRPRNSLRFSPGYRESFCF